MQVYIKTDCPVNAAFHWDRLSC